MRARYVMAVAAGELIIEQSGSILWNRYLTRICLLVFTYVGISKRETKRFQVQKD